MLTQSELAHRPDFSLGVLFVSPARRLIEGPAGKANVEPVIMQVFMVLADALGQVVTRTQLFDQVWGGAMVGDDSLNRAVGRVRKIVADVAPGFLEVETIPRTGYRLLCEPQVALNRVGAPDGRLYMSRRLWTGGALALAGAAGAGLWWQGVRENRRFEGLIASGLAALDYHDPAKSSEPYFKQAAALRPGDAKALGLLAYARALRAEYGKGNDASAAVQPAEAAAREALARDPNEPNARLAETLLERSRLDLAANEDRLRAILAMDRDNIGAMRQLWELLQCAGRSREALGLVERALVVKPLAAGTHFPRAQLLWILGRNAEADRVIDRAMRYWPAHPFVRFARFILFAFTGREQAALAMLESRTTAPQAFSPDSIAMWKLSLAAIENPTPASIAAARTANLEKTRQKPQLTRQAVMALCKLGDIDAAYEVANGQLLFRSAIEPSATPRPHKPVKSTAWIFAPWLFTPPLIDFRADPRFRQLCDGIGLSDYWERRGVKPDYPLAFV